MLFGLKMLLCYTAGIWGLFNMLWMISDTCKKKIEEVEEKKDVARRYFAFLNEHRE